MRYNEDTWKNRPSSIIWKSLKPWIGYQKGITDTALPPIYGYCIDTFRDKYGIYITVYPHMQTIMSKDGIGSELTFRFNGLCQVMPTMGKIEKEITISGLTYSTVLDSLLRTAADYLNSEKDATNK